MPPEKLSMRILFNFQKEIWLISSPAAQENFFRFSRFQNRGVLQQNQLSRPDPIFLTPFLTHFHFP